MMILRRKGKQEMHKECERVGERCAAMIKAQT